MVAERQARQSKKNLVTLKLRKTAAQVRATPADEPEILASAQVLLNDVTAKGMHLFIDRDVPIGEFVQVTLMEPRVAYVRARVSFCQEITSEIRVISAKPYPFRMSVVFMFASEEQEHVFQAYVDEICKMLEKS